MRPRFTNEDPDCAELVCPSCGGSLLHHDRVDVFERVEDAASGLRVSVANDSVLTDTAMGGNPSSRRHGVSIRFWCETCAAISALSIAQHKGSTLFSFDVVGVDLERCESARKYEYRDACGNLLFTRVRTSGTVTPVCPQCGSNNVKDKGSYDSCRDCGEYIDRSVDVHGASQ